MRLSVLCIGKLRDAHLAAVVADFEQRAQRYWPLEVRELREESARGQTPDVVREKEAERLLGAVKDGALLVACEARGREMTSEEFASWLRVEREHASRDVAFVIGGAFGLARRLTERADLRLAFSRWTLPHEMARLVLAEQLYRAGTIVRGEPYHKR
jgi:23S rRNA (pseudouridine1915-N3)-methyltransferase